MYKKVKISKKISEKDGVIVIIYNGKKWLNKKHIETQLEHSNLVQIANKYSLELRKKDKNYKIVAIINFVEDF